MEEVNTVNNIKPENIVFDSNQENAFPALCDFDISEDTNETNNTTKGYVGTSLYMPPEKNTRFERDVFSLGVAMVDILFYNGILSNIPTKENVSMGMSPLDLDKVIDQLNGSRNELQAAMQKIIQLIVDMLNSNPEKRPAIQAVTKKLKEYIELFNLRECRICMCDYHIRDMVKCKTMDIFCCKICFKDFVAHKIEEMN